MEQKKWDMQSLSEVLLQSIREYGIEEVSLGQYETVCKRLSASPQNVDLVATIKN